MVFFPAIAADHAVIFMYHRFGEDNYPTTNITLEQFEQHLQILKKGKYTVWPIPKIIDYLQSGKPLPDRTVGISIDDAAISVYQNAWPRFKALNIPFTLFITTDDIDRDSGGYMNWDQVRELAKSGLVTIGNHTKSHPHMPQLTAQQNAQEIMQAQDRFQKELGLTPELFAYPYGEFSDAVTAVVENFKFRASFGQHSGVASAADGFLKMPRFALNENYGNPERFIVSADALPLPASHVLPKNSLLETAQPKISFDVPPDFDTAKMNCYASDQGKIPIMISKGHIDIPLPQAWHTGRARINCTLFKQGRYYWWGTQYIVP